ncbi:hypothetical protein Poli38472_003687 [Pythium oligandrum]|uniref:AAA+ ATPase domain-containing protein n=1 Tax=Pythium oligandrum TaxID=41045 RepID=A0A8K1CNZ6_PYTOL|nr:hypothetical protein Poli38472_003687 [Pythium oligandrum]|eukprot:TMW65922.1 hypothetical protein Poli38472_003687 [Pythium oligandrum]
MEIGRVAVDRRVSRAQWDAGASSGGHYDTRCSLYTDSVASRHQYVRIVHGEREAYAQLRGAVDGVNAVSAALYAALCLDDSVENAVVELLVHDVTMEESCKCSMVDVEMVIVRMLDRSQPSRSILSALQRSIPKLVLDQVVWDGRVARMSWFNRPERIQFHSRGQCGGSGCCVALGHITQATKVEVVFQDSSDSSAASFNTVEEYTNQIAETVGGVRGTAEVLLRAMLSRLKSQPPTPEAAVQENVGAILCGLPGIGKTLIAKTVGERLDVPVRFLQAADVFQTYVGHSETQLVKTFEAMMHQEPSILVVDGLESVAASRQGFLDSESPLEVSVLGTFVACLDRLKSSNAHVFVLGTTSRLDDVDASVYSNGRMDLVLRMDPPSQSERFEILQVMTRGWSLEDSSLVVRLSEATGGFVGADLLSLCQKALQICVNDPSFTRGEHPTVLSTHFDQALSTTYPSVLQAHHVSLRQQDYQSKSESASSAFEGVYGVDDAVKALKVSLLEPLEDSSRFLAFGTVPPKGILLTGLPGSGKTHLANVVAAELRRRGTASFISVRCTDLLTKVVGDTEKSLRELFQTARSAAPCVIYFDQIESIAPVRGFDTSTEQTFDRLLSMLLVEMDGFSSSRGHLNKANNSEEARAAFLKSHVVILASTTEKTQLDPAILRPGRFDVHIELQLPKQNARYRLIVDLLEQIPLDYLNDPTFSNPSVVAEYVAERTEGFTAGDLAALFREAALTCLRESLTTSSIPIKFVTEALATKMRC